MEKKERKNKQQNKTRTITKPSRPREGQTRPGKGQSNKTEYFKRITVLFYPDTPKEKLWVRH